MPAPPLQVPPVAFVTEPPSAMGKLPTQPTASGPASAALGWAMVPMVPESGGETQLFASVMVTV